MSIRKLHLTHSKVHYQNMSAVQLNEWFSARTAKRLISSC